MKIVKSVSIPTAPKMKRKLWESILKKHLERSFQECTPELGRKLKDRIAKAMK